MVITMTSASAALLRRATARCGGGGRGNSIIGRHRWLLNAPAAARDSSSSSSSSSSSFDTDLLVVGCGIAGASAALHAARLGMRVTMLSSSPNVDDCNSFWAQGGIIYKAEVKSCCDVDVDVDVLCCVVWSFITSVWPLYYRKV